MFGLLKRALGAAVGRDATYDAFAAEHGRVHGSGEEYAQRLGIFRANLKFIHEHNAQNSRSHTLAPNRFTDWSEVWCCSADALV